MVTSHQRMNSIKHHFPLLERHSDHSRWRCRRANTTPCQVMYEGESPEHDPELWPRYPGSGVVGAVIDQLRRPPSVTLRFHPRPRNRVDTRTERGSTPSCIHGALRPLPRHRCTSNEGREPSRLTRALAATLAAIACSVPRRGRWPRLGSAHDYRGQGTRVGVVGRLRQKPTSTYPARPISLPGLTREGQPRLPHHRPCGSATRGSEQSLPMARAVRSDTGFWPTVNSNP